jgi:hypothetical protein
MIIPETGMDMYQRVLGYLKIGDRSAASIAITTDVDPNTFFHSRLP